MTETYLNNYFLHYAGGKGTDMQYVDVTKMLIRNTLSN
jgi:hypothetical protein